MTPNPRDLHPVTQILRDAAVELAKLGAHNQPQMEMHLAALRLHLLDQPAYNEAFIQALSIADQFGKDAPTSSRALVRLATRYQGDITRLAKQARRKNKQRGT